MSARGLIRDSQAEINQTQSSALEICDKFI
jgi:hypothetical protein